MTVLALEPQPLAFRVRPQADECFDPGSIGLRPRANHATRAVSAPWS
jgi:hypothetical protein